jgi:hypothetical protein
MDAGHRACGGEIMATELAGFVDPGKVYTIEALAKTLGYKPVCSLRQHLVDRGVPLMLLGSGKKEFVSGRFVLDSVEREAIFVSETDRVAGRRTLRLRLFDSNRKE